MGTYQIAEDNLKLEAGRLCLQFANTAEWHASPQPIEELNSYSDLVGWAKGVGLLSEADARDLREEARRRPKPAEASLRRAIALREAIYRVFSAVAYGSPVPETDLARLNSELSRALSRQQVGTSTEGFTWQWSADVGDLDRILWPTVRSAADLLTSKQLSRVGECADDRGCGWLFLDTSRNHSRRWCGMDSCGNRAKARRHYERSKRAVRKDRPTPA